MRHLLVLLLVYSWFVTGALAQTVREVAPGVTRIEAPRGASLFGTAMAMHGGVAVVGASGEDVGGLHLAGAVYVYRYDGSAWTQEARLVAWDTTVERSRFGIAVDVSIVEDRERIVIGSYGRDALPGRVYLFERDGGGAWRPDTVLHSTDSRLFGGSVSLDANRLAVGDWAGNGDRGYTGSVFVYDYADGAWRRSARIDGDNSFDRFGSQVSLSGDRLVMHTRTEEFYVPGRAFVLAKTPNGWEIEQQIDSMFPRNRGAFIQAGGWISGDRLLAMTYDYDVSMARPLLLKRETEGWRVEMDFSTREPQVSTELRTSSESFVGNTLVLPGGRPSREVPLAPTAVYRWSNGVWQRLALLTFEGDSREYPSSSVAIGFDEQVVLLESNPGKVYAFDLRRIATASEAEPAPRASALRLTPNPARYRVAVTYVLPAAGPVRLCVFDVMGREVLRQEEGGQALGPHALPLDLSALPSGLYLVRLEGPAIAQVTRLVVAR